MRASCWWRRGVTLASLVGALLVMEGVAPQVAEAQVSIFDCDAECGAILAAGFFGGIAYGLTTLGLIMEAIEKGTHRHGMYEAGAIFEIVWGSLHIAGGIVAVIAAAVFDEPAHLGAAAPLGFMGAYFLSHGVWSLGDGRPGRESVDVSAGVVPTEGGAMATVGGSF